MDEAARVGPREPGREGAGGQPPDGPRPWTISDPDRSAVKVTNARNAPARCVLCHDDEDEVDLSCPGCGATYHLACAAELGQCATRGCQADPATGRLPPAPPKTVGRLVFGVLLLVVFGLPIGLVFRVLVGFGGKVAPETRDAALFVATVVLSLVALLAPIAAIIWAVARRRDSA